MRCLGFLFVLLMSALPVLGADEDETLAMLRKGGFDAYLEGIGANIRATADRPEFFESKKDAEIWRQSADEVYDIEPLFSLYAAQVAKSLSAGEVADLTAFFDGPLGKRVTELENKTIEAQTRPEWWQNAELMAFALIPARLELYNRISDTIGALDSAVATAMNINFAMMSGMRSGGMLPGTMSDAQILEFVRAQEGDLRASIQHGQRLFSASTYAVLSDAEIEAYIAFLASPPAQKLYGSVSTVESEVLPRLAREFADILAERFNQETL